MKMSKTTRFEHHAKIEPTPRHLQIITTLIRGIESLLFLAVIARISLTFPFTYFRQFAVTILSPSLVFVVGNAIVLALFLRSGGKPSQSSSNSPDTTFIVSVYPSTSLKSSSSTLQPSAEIKINCYRRTKSEVDMKEMGERKSGSGAMVLRRSKTEMSLNQTRQESVPKDRMSGAEFRRTIEDFIARQQRFLKEEEEDANFTY